MFYEVILMIKNRFLIPLLILGNLFVASCQGTSSLHQVQLVANIEFVVPSGYQDQQIETKAAYDDNDSFMLAVYGEFCACSTIFHSVIMDYMNEKHLPFYEVVADDDLLYDFGLPIGENGVELPIFAIYELGEPLYVISYDSGHSLFSNEDSFIAWVEQRIDFVAI
jgi:hypothetical protein